MEDTKVKLMDDVESVNHGFEELTVEQGFASSSSVLQNKNQLDKNTTQSTTLNEKDEHDYSHVKGFQNTTDSELVVDLKVEGNLPKWLIGEYYTIGPGIYDIRYQRKIEVDGVLQNATGKFSFGHWFDALPLINRFDLNGERNTITYRHCIPNKRLVEKIREHHGYAPNYPAGLIKTDSNQTILIKLLNNTKVFKPDRIPCGQRITNQLPGVDCRLFSQDFSNHISELNPFDLTASRVQTFEEINPLFKGYSSCPNGQFDKETGEYINFTMEIGYGSTKYHFFSITEQEPKGQLITTIWNAPTGWVNNFALTPNYIIMVIHPMLANTGAVKFSWSESVLDSFNFYPSEPTLFYVISRKDKEVIACYRSSASFSLNQVNAFEDIHGNIVLDLVAYENDKIIHQLSTETLRNPESMGQLSFGQIRRYILNQPQHEAHSIYVNNNSFIPSAVSITSRVGTVWNYMTGQAYAPENATGSSGWHAWMPVVGFTKLSDETLELPQINPNYKMKNHSFVYGLGFSATHSVQEGKIWDSIIKIDTIKNSVVASWHEENCYPSEAQFLPKPKKVGEEQEDAGVLISIVMDSVRSTSFVLVLDAKDLKVLARIELDKLIPISFAHGCYKINTV